MPRRLLEYFLLPLALAAILGSAARADELAPIPAAFRAKHDQFAPTLSPTARQWVEAEGEDWAKATALDEPAMILRVRQRFGGQMIESAEIEEMVFLVMMQATRDQEDDVRALLAAHERAAADAEPSAKLERALDQRNRFIAALAAVAKKLTPSNENIVRSLK